MKRRSGFTVMARLIGLVKPLTGFMVLAIAMGLTGHLLAAFITILGGYAVLGVLGVDTRQGFPRPAQALSCKAGGERQRRSDLGHHLRY